MPRYKDCSKCGEIESVQLIGYCGAWVCENCGHHEGLARCFCGWAANGGNGRQQLEDMGEVIEPEEYC